jgi:hypothetical protein
LATSARASKFGCSWSFFENESQPMHWCHGGGRALCGYSRNGFIFKPRGAEGFYTYRTLRIGYPNGFSAQAVVHRGDHPHWDEYIDVVDIPGNIGPFWFELSRNTANLSSIVLV